MSNFWIDIEDISGVKLGEGPVISATFWESTLMLDRAGTFKFSIPAGDARAKVVQPKRIARCYTRVQERLTEIGAGIIDKIELGVDAQGQAVLNVSGDDMLRDLTNRSVRSLECVSPTGDGVMTALASIMGYAPSGWALDTVNGYAATATNVYAKFSGESVLNALINVGKQRGEHFRLGVGRKVVWLQKNLAACGIRAVQGGEPTALVGNRDACIITDLQEEQDTYELCSRLYPYGNGVGEARLTLAACSKSTTTGYYTMDKVNNYIQNTQMESAGGYGRIERYISMKNVAPISNTTLDLQNAANVLFDSAIEYMERHKRPEKFYRLQVTKVEKLLYPGQTIRVVLRKIVDGYEAVNIDKDLYILETTNRIDGSGLRTTDMQVATVDRYRESDDIYVIERMQEARVMESYPQLNASSYYETFYDAIDGSNALSFPFLLGKEVVNVNEVKLYFKLQQLESTAKSVAGSSTSAGPSSKATADSNSNVVKSTESQSTTDVVVGGGVNTSTVSGNKYHGHPIPIQRGDNGMAVYLQGGVLYSYGGGTPAAVAVDIGHTHNFSTPDHSHGMSHSHNVTIPGHGHGMAHSHTFTPIVTMDYGIYRGGTVPTIAQTIVKINNTTVTPAASSLSGWYEVDLTAYVSSTTTFRPNQEVNTIAISCSTGQMANVQGKLRVRTVIQAIAVL